jgi:hypothetical protein
MSEDKKQDLDAGSEGLGEDYSSVEDGLSREEGTSLESSDTETAGFGVSEDVTPIETEITPKADFLVQIEQLVGDKTGAADKTILDAETLKETMSEQLDVLDSLETELVTALQETRMRKASLSAVYNTLSKGLNGEEEKPKKTILQRIGLKKGPSV